ncbi:MAG TPA: hypothetical protein VK066_08725 [Chloroflexota bacterium]|nr:hypothetical protein [Chloroflexota bacterium]
MGSRVRAAAGALLGGALLASALLPAGPDPVNAALAPVAPAAAGAGPAAAGEGGASAAPGAALMQAYAGCRPPTSERALPESSSELRLARDANGDFWQIQSGCRHRVVPLAMDPAVLRTIPLADDLNLVTYALPAPVPTPAPLEDPAYAQVPLWLRPPATPAPPTPTRPDPGYLSAYADRVIVFDPADPDVVYLLEGGTRHRVIVYYPYCVVYPRGLPLCQGDDDTGAASVDLPRGGDPTVAPPFPYLLRRRTDADCTDLYPTIQVPRPITCAAVYEQLLLDAYPNLGRTSEDARSRARTLAAESAPYVANIEEIPLGEPAPNYGWGRGETTVLSAQRGVPEAQPCSLNARPSQSEEIGPCSVRFRDAQRVNVADYLKDPSAYEGGDIRLTGVACLVRYDRTNDRTNLSIGINQSVVSAVAYGRRARQDPNFSDDAVLDVGAVVTPQGAQAAAGQLVIFEYARTGTGTCRQPGQGQ